MGLPTYKVWVESGYGATQAMVYADNEAAAKEEGVRMINMQRKNPQEHVTAAQVRVELHNMPSAPLGGDAYREAQARERYLRGESATAGDSPV